MARTTERMNTATSVSARVNPWRPEFVVLPMGLIMATPLSILPAEARPLFWTRRETFHHELITAPPFQTKTTTNIFKYTHRRPGLSRAGAKLDRIKKGLPGPERPGSRFSRIPMQQSCCNYETLLSSFKVSLVFKLAG